MSVYRAGAKQFDAIQHAHSERKRRTRRFQPLLESLEDRISPTLALFTNTTPEGVLPQGNVGSAYQISGGTNVQFSAIGGSGSYLFSLGDTIYNGTDPSGQNNTNANIDSTLPPGLALNATTGVLTGTPTSPGVFNFIVTARDKNSSTNIGHTVYTTTIVNSLFTMAPPSLPAGTAGTSYTAPTISAVGGSGSFTFSVTAGGLPPGLSMSTGGVLSGTPAAWGQYPFTVTAMDTKTNFTNSQPYVVTINSPVSFTLNSNPAPILPYSSDNYVAIVNTPYVQPIVAGNGDSYSYKLTSNPTWISLSNNVLSGTPTASDQKNNPSPTISVTGTDAQNHLIYFSYVPFIHNQSDVPFGLPLGLPLATVGAAYSQAIAATGGSATLSNLTLSDFNGNNLSLPTWNGLTFQLSGNSLTVSGTPQSPTPGTTIPTFTKGPVIIGVTLTYNVSGGGTYTAKQQFELSVNPTSNALTILGPASGPLAPAKIGTAYSQQLSVTGGSGSYAFSIPSGANTPSWLSLSATGLLSGTPTTSSSTGVQNVIVTVADLTTAVKDSRVFQLTVSPPAGNPQFNLLQLPLAPIGAPYNQTITASGGSGSFTIKQKITHGPVPQGLSTQISGNSLTISGTPTTAAPYDPVLIQVTATDNKTAATVTQTYVLGVYYTPQQIKQAYGFNNIILSGGVIGDGTGQTVAIVVAGDAPNYVSSTDPNFMSSDLYQFDQLMGLSRYNGSPSAPKFFKLDQFGGTNYPAPSASNAGEITQDVQWVHALAPGANIILIETTDAGAETTDTYDDDIPYFIAYETIKNFQPPGGIPKPAVVTTSYGSDFGSENQTPPGQIAMASAFATTAANPLTFMFAAGDYGDDAGSHSFEYFAGLSGVVSVGYTALTLDSQNNYSQEAVVVGSGGGPSVYQLQPSWQNGVVNATSLQYKTNPDVVFNGSANTGTAVYQSFGSPANLYPWQDGDGSSMASPSFAALMAIVNQGRAAAGLTALNGPTQSLPMLYSLAGSTDYHPITQTDDGVQIAPGFTSYNPWAGLGSPVANLLVPDLVGGKNTISGTVFYDQNNSGTKEPTDPGLPGWTVFLDANNSGKLDAGEASAITDANGNYSFLVAPGNYLTRFILQSGFTQTTANPANINFPAGASGAATGVNFGAFQPIGTTTTVTSSPPAAVFGQYVILTAVITPSTSTSLIPGGNVTFFDGGKALGNAAIVNANGTFRSTLPVKALFPGTHVITASYPGDGIFTASTSTAVMVGANFSPIAGNWSGPGPDSVNLFDPVNSTFYLKQTNSGGPADLTFSYGPAAAGWFPLMGDWTGAGVDTVGLFNPASSTFYLKNSNSSGGADSVFSYGPAGAGWLPLVGDWNGNGADTVGLFDPITSTFYLTNTNGSGGASLTFQYGPAGAGWIPLAGAWVGGASDGVGLFSPATSMFFLKNVPSSGSADNAFSFGPAGAGWFPLAGNWNGSSTFTVGLENPTPSTFYLRFVNAAGNADLSYSYGPPISSFGGNPLTAASIADAAPGSLPDLSAPALLSIVNAAIERWRDTHVSEALLQAMASVQFVITRLPGSLLGWSQGHVGQDANVAIYIDRDAAGHGWFIDPTPLDDSEFANDAFNSQAGRMDLLTAVSHELGHVLGLEDLDTRLFPLELMSDMLAPGVRHRSHVSALDAYFTDVN